MSWLPYALLIPGAAIVYLVTRALLDLRDRRRSKRQGPYQAPARREETVMSKYAIEVSLSAKTGCAIPDDAVVGSELFDILVEATAADPEVPFTVTSMTIKGM
jgi:hypothetical protein